MPTTTSEPNLLGMRLAHRAMIADAARFATLTRDIAGGKTDCPASRAEAISVYLHLLCDSIHHHHSIEDEVLWPLLRTAADGAVDLRELEDDHAQLDPLLEEIRRDAQAFTRAAHGSADRLADRLRQLDALLTEHIADEENTVFPVITRYLTAEQWNRVEAAARDGAKMSFELPRMFGMCTPEEWASATAEGGIMLRLMLRVFRRGYRRRERAIAGTPR
ncbi:hemerythrin domain-containing protein [Nocardia huaxiensis]|uniref:Hemerythrin domain-containing protein n=1 Tax=Nocardia huaxiensis TaxID=2755382 RepID=A0A7D6VKK2_9NOCA|nr:hemerythrin domain-containing protein [Nocardia huaxiensis]QLY31976.1 hemerythrin domain-containing protein [Nocardia huaxiensis]UFS95548.1 hemerythrin domain-containing protein [Nocardia huaxiensis]